MTGELILGIDPGSRATGYGVILKKDNRLSCVDAGVIRLASESNFAGRLAKLYGALTGIIDRYKPSVSAVEDIFHARNAKSALLLGQARGVIILAAVHGNLEVHEYSPLEIKQAVVGYGHAEKKQVQHMVKILLNLTKKPPQDAADALAVAICQANTWREVPALSSARRLMQ